MCVRMFAAHHSGAQHAHATVFLGSAQFEIIALTGLGPWISDSFVPLVLSGGLIVEKLRRFVLVRTLPGSFDCGDVRRGGRRLAQDEREAFWKRET